MSGKEVFVNLGVATSGFLVIRQKTEFSRIARFSFEDTEPEKLARLMLDLQPGPQKKGGCFLTPTTVEDLLKAEWSLEHTFDPGGVVQVDTGRLTVWYPGRLPLIPLKALSPLTWLYAVNSRVEVPFLYELFLPKPHDHVGVIREFTEVWLSDKKPRPEVGFPSKVANIFPGGLPHGVERIADQLDREIRVKLTASQAQALGFTWVFI